MMTIQAGFSIRAGGWQIHWLFHVNSPLTYFYPSLNKVFMCCQKNSIMSVFCSNTLISAPECWKYILKAQFSNFSQELALSVLANCVFAAHFFLLRLFQSFCHLHNLIENPAQATKDCNFEA